MTLQSQTTLIRVNPLMTEIGVARNLAMMIPQVSGIDPEILILIRILTTSPDTLTRADQTRRGLVFESPKSSLSDSKVKLQLELPKIPVGDVSDFF